MCQSQQPKRGEGAKSDTWSSFGGSEDSDTTSCRAKEEERASFGEKRRDGVRRWDDL